MIEGHNFMQSYMDPAWLSLTNKRKFDDYLQQIIAS